MAVETTMLVGSEVGIRAEFAGQESTCQRDTSQNPNLTFTCDRKKVLLWLEPEQVEDELHTLNVRVADGFERLVHPLYTHPIIADFALLHQVIKDAKDLGHVVDFRRWSMQLQQIEGLHLQVAQAALNKSGQVLAHVPLGCMGVEPPSHFCSNNELRAARFAHLCDQLLGMPIAIDVSGIDEVDSEIDGPVEGSQ